MKNNQIIIPSKLQRYVLSKIHEGHFGINRCQSMARASVYWPGMNNDIFNLVSSCEICLKHSNSNPKMELMPHEIISIPWYKVGSDIFEYKKKKYILVVDYFSKFIEVEMLPNGYSSTQVVTRLKSIFSRHGIPQVFMSDNGPPYNSQEFSRFCQLWGIKHTTSSPYLPRSNGLAERSVQIIKKILIKCEEDKSDPYIALLNHRSARKEDLPSPSELLMSRQLRTKIPTMNVNYKPHIVNIDDYENKVKVRDRKIANNYNRRTSNLKPLMTGENILFKKTPSSCWYPAVVVQNANSPRSYVISTNDGVMYRRNREHIRSIDKRVQEFNRHASLGSAPRINVDSFDRNGEDSDVIGQDNQIQPAENMNESYNTIVSADSGMRDRTKEDGNSPLIETRTNSYVTGSGRTVRPPIRFTFD